MLTAGALLRLQIKAYRKDIAELLRSGKQDYARIRVEAILRENATLQVGAPQARCRVLKVRHATAAIRLRRLLLLGAGL